MNRAKLLPPLLTAFACTLPLAALAQVGDSTDASADHQAVGAVSPQFAASHASAAAGALIGSADDKAFEESARAERQRIADERAAARARYGEDQRTCWQRFAVNACLNQARDRRRATLDALRHDELVLNAQQRDRRTAARLDEIGRKQTESAQQDDSGNNANNAPAASAQTQ